MNSQSFRGILLTFKEFLLESAQTKINGEIVALNPTSHNDVWKIIPSTDKDPSDAVYKFLYDAINDDLFVWWFGDLIHQDVYDDLNLPESDYEEDEDPPIDALIGYLNLPKRVMETWFNKSWTPKEVKQVAKDIDQGKMGKLSKFAKKFKTSTGHGFGNSKFMKWI